MDHHNQCEASTYDQCCDDAQHNTCNNCAVVAIIKKHSTYIINLAIYKHLHWDMVVKSV